MARVAGTQTARALTRRQFGVGLAATLGLSGLPRLPALASQASLDPAAARRLYERAVVFDALANPGTMNVPWPPRGPLGSAQVDNVRQCGITALNVTVSADTFEATVRAIALWYGECDRHAAVMTIVRRHADIERARTDGRLGLVLGFQNTEMIERDLSRLDVFHRLGIRIIQLTYNDRNLVGDGCLEPGDAALSAFGHDVVARLNELGIAVDLSHCGTETTASAIAASKLPALITHSGCREVYRHPRSKEDRELRALAGRGGVIGIYFMPFLGGTGAPTVELLVRHIEHALKVCGEDHVGIGSDLSVTPIEETAEYTRAHQAFVEGRLARGISAPDEHRPLYIPELNTPRRLEGVAVALARRGHPARVIEKVVGSNFHRVLGEIWAAGR